jgi:hypothetical protein
MRIELKTLLGVAGILVATQAGAQVIYERPAVVVQPAPVVISPADQVYQARVISARAVAGAPEQRCWTEQKQIGPIELPGAIITGVGDLLSGQHSEMPYVQRCETIRSGTAYWDVLYEFGGTQHRVQLASPPGPTVAVNGYGDLRG